MNQEHICFIFTGVLKTDSAEYSHATSSQSVIIAPPIPNTIVAEIIFSSRWFVL
jgi:1,4-dihydroxy-2-naphthoate octaprenyltransferase